MFLQMASSLSSTFSSLVQTVPSAINAATCAGRLIEISDLKKEEVKDEKQAAHLKKEKKDGISLCLKKVDRSYQEGKQVIHQADLFAKAGEITALIGPSGEGKTTLLRLMLGLLHETSGEAWMEGADGTRCALSPASRELISYVPQGNTIFAGTIEENLKMVKADATEEELWESLRLGCAREFVEALPDGIHTYVGENGTGLSEGQAQRLAIARALLKDAPILILDEATSALDLETEANVLDHILHQNRMRTCIVTTHRESILPMSHHIYRITERRVEKLK
jgi:ABC-type bacteriocin/lantibiotic exporter with double-glycine peptidase domain